MFEIFRFFDISEFSDFLPNKIKNIGNVKIEENRLRILRISYERYLRINRCLKIMEI